MQHAHLAMTCASHVAVASVGISNRTHDSAIAQGHRTLAGHTSWQAVSSLRSESVLRHRSSRPVHSAACLHESQVDWLARLAGTWRSPAAASLLLQACGPSPVSPANANRGPWVCMVRQCRTNRGTRGAMASDHSHLKSSSVFAARGHLCRPAFASCWTLRKCQRTVCLCIIA